MSTQERPDHIEPEPEQEIPHGFLDELDALKSLVAERKGEAPLPHGQRRGKVTREIVDGMVVLNLPAEALQTEADRYLRLTPDQARQFAVMILQGADEAEGKKPTHRFIIDVPREG